MSPFFHNSAIVSLSPLIVSCIMINFFLILQSQQLVTNMCHHYVRMCTPMQRHLNNSPIDRVKLSTVFPLSELYHDQTALLPNTSSVHRMNKFILITLSSFPEDCVCIMRAARR